MSTRTWFAVAAVATAAVLFSAPVAPAAAEAVPTCSGVKGDIDGNGWPDLVVTSYGTSLLPPAIEIIFRPAGERLVLAAPNGVGLHDIAVADVDTDGCADVLTSQSDDVQLWFGRPATAGSLVPALERVTVPVPPGASHVGGTVAAAPGRIYAGTGTATSPRAVVGYTVGRDRVIANPAILTQPLPADSREGEDGDQFGSALAAEGNTVLVGSPCRIVGGKRCAGAVIVFSSTAEDPARFTSHAYTQNSPGVPGSAEKDDAFAQSLAIRDGRVAIGVPEEDLGGSYNQGLVQLATWDEAARKLTFGKAVTQNSPGVPGAAEFEDHFGRSVAIGRGITKAGSCDVVIGVPDERLGPDVAAGYVNVVPFTGSGGLGLSQNLPAIPGTAEDDDQFGLSVAVLPDSTTSSTTARDRIAIAVPAESLSTKRYAGVVQVSQGFPLSGSPWHTYHNGAGDISEIQFAWSISG